MSKEGVSFQWFLFCILLKDADWCYVPWKEQGKRVVRATETSGATS